MVFRGETLETQECGMHNVEGGEEGLQRTLRGGFHESFSILTSFHSVSALILFALYCLFPVFTFLSHSCLHYESHIAVHLHVWWSSPFPPRALFRFPGNPIDFCLFDKAIL